MGVATLASYVAINCTLRKSGKVLRRVSWRAKASREQAALLLRTCGSLFLRACGSMNLPTAGYSAVDYTPGREFRSGCGIASLPKQWRYEISFATPASEAAMNRLWLKQASNCMEPSQAKAVERLTIPDTAGPAEYALPRSHLTPSSPFLATFLGLQRNLTSHPGVLTSE